MKKNSRVGNMRGINPKIPTQLWDQWLSRLHGIEDPQKNYYRLELLALISSSNITDKSRFLNRFGTVMHHSISCGSVLIVSKDRKHVFYRDSSARTSHIDTRSLESLPTPNGSLITKQLEKPKKIISNKAPFQAIVWLPIVPIQDTYLLILLPSSLANEDKQFISFIGNLLKALEEKVELASNLKQEQRLLELLTQHISEGLVLFSSDKRIKIWNRPLQRITGVSPKEAKDRQIAELLKPVNNPGWLDDLIEQHQKSRQSGFVLEVQISTKSKEPKWIWISGSFLRKQNGEIEQVIAIIRDISKEKELEERKNEFISIATHELRTPLTAIKGYLSLLQSTTKNFTPQQHRYLDNAYLATERLTALAEDLLQVIRIDEDRMKFNIQPVELTKIIEKIASDFSDKARRKGLEFSITLPPFQTTVAGDPIRLEQVFSNLIDNAIKYTQKGSVSISFEHYTEKTTKEDKVTVIIRDTGIGISAKDIEAIFDKFSRSDQASRLRESGVGLGLYIVKSFIQKQNGTITVKSKMKKGSVFAVTFPTVSTKPANHVKNALASRKNRSSMGEE